MKFGAHSARRLLARELDPQLVALLFARFESIVPYLRFKPWSVQHNVYQGPPRGHVMWRGAKRHGVTLSIVVNGLIATSVCERDQQAISASDHRFLGHLAQDAAQALHSALTGPLPLVEFGTAAVADAIGRDSSLGYDPLPLLQHVRAFAQETYEGERLAYGIILTNSPSKGVLFTATADNKRFKRLTDGFATALVLGEQGRISGLVTLQPPIDEGTKGRRRPWWVSGLAHEAATRDGVGIALTRNGDLLVVQRGQLTFSQRAGRWRRWNHSATITRLRRLWDFAGRPRAAKRVLTTLYHLALDLSFRRAGALFVLVGSDQQLRSLLTSRNDEIGSKRRSQAEQSLDAALHGKSILTTDRRIAGDLGSLDGALVVDRSGAIRAYGAMTTASHGARQGARTRAAYAASRHGVVLKVSSDGDIGFFRRGKCAFET